jgi:hypothetical protein
MKHAAFLRLDPSGALEEVFRCPFNPESLVRERVRNPGSGRFDERLRLELLLHELELAPPTDPDDDVTATYARIAALEENLAAPGLLVLRWGQREIPVRIERLAISEDRFDPELMPLQATATVECVVPGGRDLANEPGGQALLEAYRALRKRAAVGG